MKHMMMAAAIAAAGCTAVARAGQVVLSNGSDEGDVQITVEDTGTSDNGNYRPLGDANFSSVIFDSEVYARIGDSGDRTSVANGTVNTPNSGNSTSTSSTFSLLGLNFSLTQALSPLKDAGGNQTGTLLTQTYNIHNPGNTDVNHLEMVRYFDGDLEFDGSLDDGGGRLDDNGTEFLFETDQAGLPSDSTTFVGITAEGGAIPTNGRYQALEYRSLQGNIENGDPLDDTIQGDGPDADQFVDAGNGYDITLGFLNVFDIAAGQNAVYTTQTFFGRGLPTQVAPPPPNAVPLPAAVWMGGMTLGGLGLLEALRRRRTAA